MRAHVKGKGITYSACNSASYPARLVAKEAIVEMKLSDACQRCYRIVMVEKGYRFLHQ